MTDKVKIFCFGYNYLRIFVVEENWKKNLHQIKTKVSLYFNLIKFTLLYMCCCYFSTAWCCGGKNEHKLVKKMFKYKCKIILNTCPSIFVWKDAACLRKPFLFIFSFPSCLPCFPQVVFFVTSQFISLSLHQVSIRTNTPRNTSDKGL